jgi:ribokinase
LERVGVFCGGVIRHREQQTGTAIILHNGSSKRIITTGGANRLLAAVGLPSESLASASHVHLATSNNTVALHALALAKQGGATTSSDLNGPASLERLRLLDLCIMNFDDLCRWLGGDSPFTAWDDQFAGEKSYSPPALVVTDSSRGAMIYCDGRLSRIPTEPVMPVDRTGGGDAFSAGLIWCFVQNHQLTACVRFGLALAKRVILAVGSRPPVDLSSDEFLLEAPT